MSRLKIHGKPRIRVGDTTTHGGKVITGSETVKENGIPIARKGDKVTCPLCEPHIFVIAEGLANCLDHGIPIAVEGHETTCGAKLIAVAADQSPAEYVAMAAAIPASFVASGFSAGGTQGQGAQQQTHDEQIQFVDKAGKKLKGIEYKLYSGDQLLQSGVTDQNGLTSRVTSGAPMQITKAVLTLKTAKCCGNLPTEQSAEVNISVKISGVKTNSTGIGSSFVQQKVKLHERPLTAGEIQLAQSIFGKGIDDYSTVLVHNHGFPWFLGLQPSRAAVTPNGEMYFPAPIYKDDYSDSTVASRLQHLFIHEMVHVWQHKLGYPVAMTGLFASTIGSITGYGYDYTLKPNSKLSDYPMEGQANIIADYAMYNFYSSKSRFNKPQYSLPELQAVLADFINNPSDKKNLPPVNKSSPCEAEPGSIDCLLDTIKKERS